jgi:hypothetical protein
MVVVAEKEAYTVQTVNIISQQQYFVGHCLSSFVGNVFGLHSIWICFSSTHKPVALAMRTDSSQYV